MTGNFPDVLTDNTLTETDGEENPEQTDGSHGTVKTVQSWNASLSQLHSYLTY